jgi:nucleotide-binding universal stress UspA family protein
VSRDALRQASTSVVCIPSAEEDPRVGVPPIRNVLVATDFSATGNSAVALAYGVVSPGGTVHLLHVVRGEGGDPTQPSDIFVETEAQARAHTQDRQSLLALVPADALHEGKDSRAHVVTSHDTATAIAQAAERLGADLICLGTHGRTGLRKALMGSVAEAVFEHTHRPVLFARLPPQ